MVVLMLQELHNKLCGMWWKALKNQSPTDLILAALKLDKNGMHCDQHMREKFVEMDAAQKNHDKKVRSMILMLGATYGLSSKVIIKGNSCFEGTDQILSVLLDQKIL